MQDYTRPSLCAVVSRMKRGCYLTGHDSVRRGSGTRLDSLLLQHSSYTITTVLPTVFKASAKIVAPKWSPVPLN